MELYSIGKFAKMIGVTPSTLRRMQKSGELIPAHISNGGTRYYSSEQFQTLLNATDEVKNNAINKKDKAETDT